MSIDERDYYNEKQNRFASSTRSRLREIGGYPDAPLPSSFTWWDEIVACHPWAKPLIFGLIIVIIGLMFAALHEILSKKAYFTPKPLVSAYSPPLQMDGKKIVLYPDRNGQYSIPVLINGVERIFLVDTGANHVAIDDYTARISGVRHIGQIRSRTANGIAHGWAGVANIRIGPYSFNNVQVGVLPKMSAGPLLGMSILGQFEVVQSGNRMTLGPR